MQGLAQLFSRINIRWMAATVAAIGLHALLCYLPLPKTITLERPLHHAMQITLLAPVEPAPDKPVQATKNHQPIKPKRPPVKEQKYPKINRLTPIIRVPQKKVYLNTQVKRKPIIRNVKELPLLLRDDVRESSTSSPQKERPSAMSTATHTVPTSVQRHILTAVRYPRQARRHGWQGEAEFQFDVRQHTIRNIILLTSSGRPVLDRAARRGLNAINPIELADGRYRMPIVFHLR